MSGSKGTESTSVTETKTPEQKALAGKLIKEFEPAVGAGEKLFPGAMVAPFTSAQQAALTAGEQFLPFFQPRGTEEIPLFGETEQALKGVLTGTAGAQPFTQPQTESFISEAIAKPRRFTFENIIRPLTREEFAGPGFSGSARAQEVVRRGAETERGISEQSEQVRFGIEQFNKQLQQEKAQLALAATGQAQQFAQLPIRDALLRLTGTEELLNFASAGQQQQQAMIKESIERYKTGQRLVDTEKLQIMLALLGIDFTTKTEIKGGGSSQAGLGSAVGAGIGLLIGSSFGTPFLGAAAGGAIGGGIGSAVDF